MKKYNLIFLLVTFTSFISAQKDNHILVPFDSASQKYTYKKIIEIPEKAAPELFKMTKKWCISKNLDNKFLNEETDQQLSDLGSFPVNVNMKAMGMVLPIAFTAIYTIDITFKDGKCRVIITNIKLSQNSSGTTEESTLESYKKNQESINFGQRKKRLKTMVEVFNEIDRNIKITLVDLENTLKNKTDKSDW